MEKTLFVLSFLLTSLLSNNFEINLEHKNDFSFQDKVFLDRNSSIENLDQKEGITSIDLLGNYNDIVGFEYSYSILASKQKLSSQEVYLGTPAIKYLSIKKEKQEINYTNASNSDQFISKKSQEYILYNFLTYKRSKYDVLIKNHSFTHLGLIQKADVTQKSQVTIISVSSDNYYDMVKEDAIANNNYFNGIALSTNFSNNIRVYGLVLASIDTYESHYSNNFDSNGTSTLIKEASTDSDHDDKASYRGYSYGLKITVQKYWANSSLALTAYTKDTKLKNSYKTNSEGTIDETEINIFKKDKISFSNRYMSLAYNYKF
jgi:hypothetical protein